MRISGIFILSLVLLLPMQLRTENTYVDSLTSELSKAQSKHQKADIYFKLSDHWSYIDTIQAFQMLDEAKKLINKNDMLYQGLLTFYKAGIYFDLEMEKSQQLYMDAVQILSVINSPLSYEYQARAWHNYGVLEQLMGKDEVFLDILLNKCIPLIKKTNNKSLYASYLINIGLIFFNTKEFEKSIRYYKEALEVLDEHKIKDKQTFWAYVNMAHSYCYLNAPEDVKEAVMRAESMLNESNIAGEYYSYVSFFYLVQSKYYHMVNETEKAIEIAKKGMRHSKKYNLRYDYNSLAFWLNGCLQFVGRYKEARQLLLDYKNDTSFYLSSSNKVLLLKDLAKVDGLLGDYQSAYETMNEVVTLKDSIHRQNRELQISELESQYKVAEKEKQILVLENNNKIQRLLISGTLLISVLLVIFFVYALKQRKKRTEQQLRLANQEKHIEMTKTLIEGEEQERSRVAKEIHDGILGRLTGIKINLESTARNFPQPSLLHTIDHLDSTLKELRAVSQNLMPESLSKYGLKDAIEDYVQNMQTPDTKITFYSHDLSSITNKKTQLAVFRIVQELVNNAVRHAKASRILLQTTVEDNLLLIDIEDDGIGFDPKTVNKNMGLNNIETRVKFLQGDMKIQSQSNKGTIINIECYV